MRMSSMFYETDNILVYTCLSSYIIHGRGDLSSNSTTLITTQNQHIYEPRSLLWKWPRQLLNSIYVPLTLTDKPGPGHF